VRAAVVVLACLPILASCSNSDPKTPRKSDEVPANSLNDAKLHEDAGPGEVSKDRTQPLTTKVGETPLDPSSLPSGGGGGGAAANPGGKPNPNAASKAECDKAMDKYLSLEIASNPQLKGVPPEIIEQAKQMAREQHGEAPCTATKAQYKCAMGAASVAAWQKCMK